MLKKEGDTQKGRIISENGGFQPWRKLCIILFTINNSKIIFLIASVFTFSCDKSIRTISTSYNYSFLSLLPNLPLSLYNHIFKILSVPTSRQSKEFNFFDSNLSKKMELGLGFHKTNPRIRITMLEIWVWNLRKLVSK